MSNLLVQNIKHTNNTTAQTIDTSGRTTVSIMNNDSTYRSDGGAVTQNLVQGVAKAWVRMDTVGTASTAGNFNISSLTDNGTGEVFPNITNSFSDLHFVTVGGANGAGVVNFAGIETRRESTSQINMRTFNTSTNGLADFYYDYCTAHGDLA